MIEVDSGFAIDTGVIITGLILILLGLYAASQAKSIGDIILEKLHKSEEKIIAEIWRVKS